MIASPLRYPGGKARLFPFFARLIQENSLFGAHYCEPYAGGAGLAIRLLTNGFVDRISINDIDRSIYAFWVSALRETDKFCKLIEKTPVTIAQWHKQRRIWQQNNCHDLLSLGFAAYFLNRTNRSGIIEGAGPIGGYHQSGDWKLGVRLVKEKQIENLKMLARYAKQISVTKMDALKFFQSAVLKERSFLYLDPPYFVKGHKLYKNFYEAEDHLEIAAALSKHGRAKWVVSYDDVPEIRKMYADFSAIRYSLNYSAGPKSLGSEILFGSRSVVLPRHGTRGLI